MIAVWLAICNVAVALSRPMAWLPRFPKTLQRARRVQRCARNAVGAGLPDGRTEAFIASIEEYNPEHAHEDTFEEGPPPTGFRSLAETIRPYHPKPEWMIFPEPGFERDQKITSMYTLASPLFRNCNSAMRDDNEDSMRRHAAFIHELREVLRFKVDTICTPQGRKCRPFTGRLLRGLDLPVDECAQVADLYKVGTEFTWPAFTACQLEDSEGGLWPFDGNLNFEIECNVDPKSLEIPEVYAPVRIGRFLGGSTEVLLPPQTRFKVVAEREVYQVTEQKQPKDVYTKILEVIDLPAPWNVEKARKKK